MCSSQNPDLLVQKIAEDLSLDRSVALGFEAPLYIPIPKLSSALSRARPGENSRAWSAHAGLSVASLGIHQAAWILREIRVKFEHCRVTVDVSQWPPSRGQATLFLWEAFVSNAAHSNDHRRDAATAVDFFVRHERELHIQHALTEVETPLSLIGAAVIWSKWSSDVDNLFRETLVLRPDSKFSGDIGVL